MQGDLSANLAVVYRHVLQHRDETGEKRIIATAQPRVTRNYILRFSHAGVHQPQVKQI